MKKWAAAYGTTWDHYRDFALEVRASYEDNLSDLMYSFEPSPHAPLSEQEVYAGTILGRAQGAAGKPLRDLSKTMRERFEMGVEYAVNRITKGDVALQDQDQEQERLYETYDERKMEALPRAIACLSVAVTEQGVMDRRVGRLQNFACVAAGVCLSEFQRYRLTTYGAYTLPRMTE